eukprot:scaffold41005_cov110-Phaeocystis_antarctica.AAC.3
MPPDETVTAHAHNCIESVACPAVKESACRRGRHRANEFTSLLRALAGNCSSTLREMFIQLLGCELTGRVKRCPKNAAQPFRGSADGTPRGTRRHL